MELQDLLTQPLVFKRKLFKFFGSEVSVFDQQENLVLFVKQKAFKLKEDIRVYADKSQTQEILLINARQILDFQAAYNVIDSQTQEKIGAIRRKGWSSIVRDQWELLDKDDKVIGNITEDSTILALVRRFLSNLVPQTHHFRVGDVEIALLKQRFNPFILKSDFSVNGDGLIDPRLALAGAVLLLTIEGRQN